MSLKTRARKHVNEILELPIYGNASYVEIAKKLAQRKDVAIEGLDLEKKSHAQAFIVAFALRHGMKL